MEKGKQKAKPKVQAVSDFINHNHEKIFTVSVSYLGRLVVGVGTTEDLAKKQALRILKE